MRTRSLGIVIGILAVLSSTTGSWAEEDNLKQLSEGGITVSYPAGMEVQAKHILEIARTSIGPSLDVNKQLISFLGNAESLSKDIAMLLGYQEKQDKAKASLVAYRDKSEALVKCFSTIKLIKKADAVATGGIDAGVLQVRYDKDKDEFNMTIDTESVSSDKAKMSYFPVLVNTDGTLRAEKKLGEMAVDFLGSSRAMVIAPVHDTVGSIMALDLNLYQPFARWFNEGVSGWITRHVVTKADPKLAALANDLFTTNENTEKYRAKVNFIAWPQYKFQNLSSPDFDSAFESAQTQYAIELVAEILGKTGPQVLPKIMREVNFNANADTDTIIAAIKKVTGKDVRPMFMNYVPQSIRSGIASGEPKKLLTKAEALAGEKKWADSASKIRLALQMDPTEANARLNLAWIERETGQRLDSEIQVFLAARLLSQGKHSFHMYGESLEGNYILGRFAILMGNLEYAKKFLQPVLDANPNHPDAKRAMQEIKTLEATVEAGQQPIAN